MVEAGEQEARGLSTNQSGFLVSYPQQNSTKQQQQASSKQAAASNINHAHFGPVTTTDRRCRFHRETERRGEEGFPFDRASPIAFSHFLLALHLQILHPTALHIFLRRPAGSSSALKLQHLLALPKLHHTFLTFLRFSLFSFLYFPLFYFYFYIIHLLLWRCCRHLHSYISKPIGRRPFQTLRFV